MKVFCQYSLQLDNFLKSIVEYVFAVLGNGLHLDKLEEIELVNAKEFSYDTDGRTIDGGKRIILTSRLYTQLPIYNISELMNNEKFKLIVNTLYHEMGHVSDMETMPIIYAVAQNLDDMKQMLPAFFWAEYLAEKRSSATEIADQSKYCDDFVRKQWKANKFDTETATEENFFYLCKALSYYMGRTTKLNTRETYNSMMVNPLLQEFVTAIGQELICLERKLPFDDAETLSNLNIIMEKYRLKFEME